MRNEPFSTDEMDPEDLTQLEAFAACRKVLEAGIWLVRNDHGRMGILPYPNASGSAWRCEFHPPGRPSKPFYRYSSANGTRYLENHCGGHVPKNISAQKLATALMVSVDSDVRHRCSGPASPEMLAWLDSLERVLAGGYLPEAFSDAGSIDGRWMLVSPSGQTSATMEPQPGYVEPGKDRGWRDEPYWQTAESRWQSIVSGGVVRIDPAHLDPLPGEDQLLEELPRALQETSGLWDWPAILRATIGTLVCQSPASAEKAPSSDSADAIYKISLSPSDNPVVRRGTRLLSMVHELHKAGFQRLRVSFGWPADGGEWRCFLGSVADFGRDGWTPAKGAGGHWYTSSDGVQFFGWTDTASDDARQLAAKFIERLPDTAAACRGADWEYAGWLTSILGTAEHGTLPALYGGIDFSSPPGKAALPPMNFRTGPSSGESDQPGIAPIATEHLRRSDVPARGSRYEELEPFCLTFDGYRDGLRTPDDCFHVLEVATRIGLDRASTDNLRTGAFILQRKIRNNTELMGTDPFPPELRLDLELLKEVMEAIRSRLTQ